MADETNDRRTSSSTAGLSSGLLLLAIAYLGFVSIGLPDTVAGIAWPSVRGTFALPQSAFGWVFLALGGGYCLSAFFGGRLMDAWGIGWLLTISSGLVVLAMFGFAAAPIWPLFVLCAIVWGLGSGAIDTGLNTYVSAHFSAWHVNWLHACYSFGTSVGPLLMTAVLVREGSWRTGYGIVGGLILIMTLLFLVTRRAWGTPPPPASDHEGNQVGMSAALRQPLVWLQMLVFLLYVGLEFTVGQWSFTLLTESRGMSREVAGTLAGSYYAGIGLGRVLFGMIAERVGLDRLLRGTILTAVVGALLFAVLPSLGSYCGLALIGFGLAPVFPCLMAGTPRRLGKFATHAFGFQVSAGMVGVMTIPSFAGLLAEVYGLEVVAKFAVGLAALLLIMHEVVVAAGVRARPRFSCQESQD